MVSLIGGLISLAVESIRATYDFPDLKAHDLINTSPRQRRAIRALMDYPEGSEGWVPPGHLYAKGVCGYNKTTETWRELEELNLLDVTNNPTRIRLKNNSKKAMVGIFSLLMRSPEFEDVLIETHTQPTIYFLDNKQRILNTFKELRDRRKKLDKIRKEEVKAKKKRPAKK